MRTLRALWKILRGLWHLLAGLWTIYIRFPRLSLEQREMQVQAWSLKFLALWGIHLQVIGQPVRGSIQKGASTRVTYCDCV